MIIREKDRIAIISIAKRCLTTPLKIWAFGSRVTGEAYDMSDLDLVIITDDKQKLNHSEFINFRESLTDSNIPILIDILDWNRIPESFHKNILRNYEELVVI